MHCYWQQFLTQQKLFYYVTLQLFMTCLSCLVNGPCVSFLCCFSVGVYSYCNCYYCQQLGGGGFCMLCTQTLAVYSLRFMMNTKGALSFNTCQNALEEILIFFVYVFLMTSFWWTQQSLSLDWQSSPVVWNSKQSWESDMSWWHLIINHNFFNTVAFFFFLSFFVCLSFPLLIICSVLVEWNTGLFL